MPIESEYELDLEDSFNDLKEYLISPDKLILGQELGRGQFGSVTKAAYTTELMGTVSTNMVAIKFLLGMYTLKIHFGDIEHTIKIVVLMLLHPTSVSGVIVLTSCVCVPVTTLTAERTDIQTRSHS